LDEHAAKHLEEPENTPKGLFQKTLARLGVELQPDLVCRTGKRMEAIWTFSYAVNGLSGVPVPHKWLVLLTFNADRKSANRYEPALGVLESWGDHFCMDMPHLPQCSTTHLLQSLSDAYNWALSVVSPSLNLWTS
jgi:hypothetical protein